jgi:hypothetical protein
VTSGRLPHRRKVRLCGLTRLLGMHARVLLLPQAVRQAVHIAEPRTEVFEVKHTGYVVLQRAPLAGSAARAGWEMRTQAGETGVMWFNDD